MLIIRLSRIGKKKQPSYRVTISEKTRDPWGKVLEILGNYNPRSKKLEVNSERVKHWLSKGATVSDTLWNQFLKNGLIQGKKRPIAPRAKTKTAVAPTTAKTEEIPAAE
jgi:small subunit ribosomal protein S16